MTVLPPKSRKPVLAAVLAELNLARLEIQHRRERCKAIRMEMGGCIHPSVVSELREPISTPRLDESVRNGGGGVEHILGDCAHACDRIRRISQSRYPWEHLIHDETRLLLALTAVQHAIVGICDHLQNRMR